MPVNIEENLPGVGQMCRSCAHRTPFLVDGYCQHCFRARQRNGYYNHLDYEDRKRVNEAEQRARERGTLL